MRDNADNTDNWKDTKLPYFPELVDFSVSCWQLMLYRKTRILFLADFKSFASIMYAKRSSLAYIHFKAKNVKKYQNISFMLRKIGIKIAPIFKEDNPVFEYCHDIRGYKIRNIGIGRSDNDKSVCER